MPYPVLMFIALALDSFFVIWSAERRFGDIACPFTGANEEAVSPAEFAEFSGMRRKAGE